MEVPIIVSYTHIHLCPEHMQKLFGNEELTPQRMLSQPNQFAANETLDIKSPKGIISGVKIYGPLRAYCQLEITRSDAEALGLNPPVRHSGDINDTPGIVLIGPKGEVELEKGVIIAAPHIHIPTDVAQNFKLNDNDRVQITVKGDNEICYHNIKVRVSQDANLTLHLNPDEAEASGIKNGDLVIIDHKNFTVFGKNGEPINIMRFRSIKFSFVTNPQSYLGQEGLRLLRNIFELNNQQSRRITVVLLQPQLKSPNKFYMLVAHVEDEIVGVAVFYFLAEVNLGYLEYIGIKPGRQEKGLGTYLYDKVISALHKDYPETEGILLEVRNVKEQLAYRKDFFLNIGAIPIDLTFYPLENKILENKPLIMFHPLRSDICLNWLIIQKIFKNLSSIL